MAEPERLTLSGDTYIAYDFDIFPIDADFHPVAAVYVVTRRTGRGGPGEHEVLYVGETARLQEHFINHPQAECFTRHKADCVGVHRQDDGGSRRETVSDLAAELKPPCNE
jgi:hypothetical protein